MRGRYYSCALSEEQNTRICIVSLGYLFNAFLIFCGLLIGWLPINTFTVMWTLFGPLFLSFLHWLDEIKKRNE
jgi:hypothetical protein